MKKRINVQVEEDTLEWIRKQAEKFGISVSAMMNIAAYQYKQQIDNMKQLKDIPSILEKIEYLQKEQINRDTNAK